MSLNAGLLPPMALAIVSSLAIWIIGAVLAALMGAKAKHQVCAGLLFFGSFSLFLAAVLFYKGAGLGYDGHGIAYDFPTPCYFGLAPFSLRLDALSCFFLGILSVLGCSVAIYSPGYLRHYKEQLHAGLYWSCMFIFMTAMALVLLSVNAITFLIFWEVMSLSSMILVASDHTRQRVQRAALIYLGATRIASALLTGGFLWMHFLSHSWNFADWQFNLPAAYMPALLIFLGFCIKAGIWPFHIWLPYAYPAAPAPVSALMSSVMKNIVVYGIIRLLLLGNLNCIAIAYLALFLGTVSAFWGVLFALIEQDLKWLLAYSSVENIGLVFIALALTLIAKPSACVGLAGLALAAALFHCLNHAIFKTLLFMGAGAIDIGACSRDLGVLGGLGKRMPYTMSCFLIGSLSISALPPFNGFASKWLIYKSLFQLAIEWPQIIDRALALTIVGILSFVGALSLACYTKATGICFLGRPRSEPAANAVESPNGMIVAQVFLAGACLLLGLMVPQVMRVLHPVCNQVLPFPVETSGFFYLPMGNIVIIGFLVIAATYILLFRRTRPALRKYVTWDCGYGDLPARAEETGTSFSEPIARIFGPLLQYHMTSEIKGKDRRHFPEVIKFESVTAPLLEKQVYGPMIAAIQAVSKFIVKLQTGSIHLYLAYVFVTLLVLLALGTRL